MVCDPYVYKAPKEAYVHKSGGAAGAAPTVTDVDVLAGAKRRVQFSGVLRELVLRLQTSWRTTHTHTHYHDT